ncbi:MAG: 2-C-methyl-D-erythritol 2,4-cyclodiphosphate synthase [Candidatus Lightella neohaematopini]|nr:2-C-methyl-D-erythritol 2,4-cyclodiphosphate synthase [Candidatus Lightella neohaematopini]MCV2528728.1 2-C-methyl-D-erythritol 2,4-cyclodiphosphate synthase [Candidatus Lightella neohaematopini]
MRIGYGFDIHKFDNYGSLILGGVKIPTFNKLFAHSDGDVLLHAIIDALLGAANMNDIGNLFPNNRKYKNINSRIMLINAWKIIKNKNRYNINNIDTTIIAQKPKLSKFFHRMKTNISVDLNCSINDINIKATTTNGVPFINNTNAIACVAIVLLS